MTATHAHPDLFQRAADRFRAHFKRPHAVAAHAPGRVEVLGNHTDYNEGFVLSAAINFGTYLLAAPADGPTCRLVAGDLMQEAVFPVDQPARQPDKMWANYVIGVVDGLRRDGAMARGFDALFLGDVPLGSGLSSSAALEMTAATALCALYGLQVDKLDLARIGQRSEHEFVGAKTGLLDQISSLFGVEDCLVMSDFRTLEIRGVPLGHDACFLICNTNVKHALVSSEYNERRARCEQAAAHFAKVLPHPVKALRDVSEAELRAHATGLDPVAAKRAAHVVGENARVRRGQALLAGGDLAGFGQLMFASHDSSRHNFENSCPELDFLVDQARRVPGVLGARLSGGGFGGSVVVLIHPRDADAVSHALRTAYQKQYGHPCDARVIRPSAGARVVQ